MVLYILAVHRKKTSDLVSMRWILSGIVRRVAQHVNSENYWEDNLADTIDIGGLKKKSLNLMQ